MKLIVKKDALLLDYLINNLDISRKKIKQYLSHGAIYVNNVKITKFDYKLTAGMNIIIDSDSKNKKKLPFDILFEDDNIIVVNKPSGLLTISTAKEKEKTLYHIVRNYLVSKNKHSKIFIVHRLDKDTSGIIIFAKNIKIKNQLQENWNEFVKLRQYVAVVYGHTKKSKATITQNLMESKNGLVYVCKKNSGKQAITNYKVIKTSNNYTMLDINIETGRKNQIRVALASNKTPIVGDKKYGNKKDPNTRLFLHANRLKIYYPVIKKDILFETQTPIEFKKILNNDRG